MIHVLHNLFLKDTINSIEEKYKDFVKFHDEKYFSYANIFNLPLYYKLFSLKKNADYGLYNKLQNTKNDEVVEYLINKIREENYSYNLHLFLYSYICNIVLNTYIDEYIAHTVKFSKFSSKKRKMRKYSEAAKYIEAQYYKTRFYKPIKKYPLNTKLIHLEDECFDTINELCSKIYYFSYGADVFKISYNKFKKYQKKNYKGCKLINILTAGFLDTFTRSKKYSAASIYQTKTPFRKDYLNKENKMWINYDKDCFKSFLDIYDEAIKTATNLINLISEEIHYKTKKTIEINTILNRLKK